MCALALELWMAVYERENLGMKVSWVLLAAGESKRHLGGHKLLVPFREGPCLLQRQIQFLTSVTAAEKILVVNSLTRSAAAGYLSADSGVCLVANLTPEKGLHSSIKQAISSSQTSTVGWILWLADLYQLQPAHFEQLQMMVDKSEGEKLVAPAFKGQRGHPVFIPQKWRHRILSEPDADHGCRYLWQENPKEQLQWEWPDASILNDLDFKS